MVATADTRDQGFSLPELIIVLALLGAILMITYGGITAIYASRDVSDRQAIFAAEVSSPLADIEEVVSQALTIEQAGPYTITVLTDADNNNLRERHTIWCTTGGQLVHRRWATNQAQVNTELQYEFVWSTNNTNQADTTPLFIYFDEDGTQTTVAGDVETVQATIAVQVDDREYHDSRTVFMRNH